MKRIDLRTKVSKEQGFISIFSVLIIMSILSLIVIGFSIIVRRAQQQALDNQLSNQAFYAAESGVNDAVRVIKRELLTSPNYSKTTCQSDPANFSYNNNLDATLNTGYTCVLVNTVNSELKFTNVPVQGTSSPVVVSLKTSTNSALRDFIIEWNSSASGFYSGIDLPPKASWSSNLLGMIRIDLVPDDPVVTANYSRSGLATTGFTFYLLPTSNVSGVSSVQVDNGSSRQGEIYKINNCTTSSNVSSCNVAVRLNQPAAAKYYMRLQAIYTPVNVTLSDPVDVNNVVGSWENGQATIDVTGKANDVYRRIQVRLPLLASGFTSTFSLESANSICKILNVQPGSTSPDTGTFGATAPADNSCLLN